jgi:hypothetical protein
MITDTNGGAMSCMDWIGALFAAMADVCLVNSDVFMGVNYALRRLGKPKRL